MNNKFIKKNPEFYKKNSLKFHRNATLDSTTSSLKLQKVKLYDGHTPLIKITKNATLKNIMDFPVCLSLYTNNISTKEEKENKNVIPLNKGINLAKLNHYNLKQILSHKFNNNRGNELILPSTKKPILNRNSKLSSNNIFTPINSNVKNYLLNINKINFQSSRNISKPKLKKIQYEKLSKFTQRNKPTKLLKNLNLNTNENKKIINTKKTYDFDISEIKNKKFSFGVFKLDLKKQLNKINNLKDDDKKSNNINIDNNELDINKNNNIVDQKIELQKDKENNIINNENINKINKGINKNKIKKINSVIVDLKQINNKKEKSNNNNKHISVDLKPINELKIKEAFENKISFFNIKNGQISPTGKLNLSVYDEKIEKIYSKINFLNEINEELTEKLINKRINTKIISQKSFILTNIKENINSTIIIEKNKIMKHKIKPLTASEIKNMISPIFMENYKNKNPYKEKIASLFSIQFNYKFNCIICDVLRDYIFIKYEYDRMSIANIEKAQKSKNIEESEREGNLIKKLKSENKIQILKRNHTFLPQTNSINKKEISVNHFSYGKSKNIKFTKELRKSLSNFIVIQEFILKSLYYYKEGYIKLINYQAKRTSNFRTFDKNLSTKFDIMRNLDKKNSLNTFSGMISGSNKRLERRRGSILKIENIRETLRIKNIIKTESNEIDLILLKHKTFFKKKTLNTEVESNDDTNKLNEKNKTDTNERNAFLESLYFQLMKSILDGKTKFFINFFLKNRKQLDINQILIEGNTLLIIAVKEGNYQIVKFLCEHNADINIQNNEGNTALHFAIGKHFYSIADLLTKYGAIEDIQNIRGHTPWDCIERKVE